MDLPDHDKKLMLDMNLVSIWFVRYEFELKVFLKGLGCK